MVHCCKPRADRSLLWSTPVADSGSQAWFQKIRDSLGSIAARDSKTFDNNATEQEMRKHPPQREEIFQKIGTLLLEGRLTASSLPPLPKSQAFSPKHKEVSDGLKKKHVSTSAVSDTSIIIVSVTV